MRRVLLLVVLVVSVGCEKERPPPPAHEPSKVAPTTPFGGPEKVKELVDDDVPRHPLELAESKRYPDCWEFLESDGKPVSTLPSMTDDALREGLASCRIEAWTQLEDGTRIFAWGSEGDNPESRARDLVLGVWESDGTLRWSSSLDRQHEEANWVANFRESFIAPLLPLHICYGTLWEGDTQVTCLDAKTGESRWNGTLPFWSGMAPQPVGDGLVVADLTSMTKRYPYSGEEMKHRKLEGMGGRAGYYATDGKRLYFTASRNESPPLVAYDLETFEEVWRVPLPEGPKSSLELVLPEFETGFMKLGDALYAYDTESGKIRWSYAIGEDIPPIVAHDGAIYVLHRRPEESNLIVRIDPATGERVWLARTPTGTLRLESIGEGLFVGSVRAVQRVTNLDPSGADGGD